jgi:NADH:ubiquinone reductase (H+-translocating)
LLPEVAAGVLEPRRVCVSLPDRLPKVKLKLGTVTDIDINGHGVEWVDPRGGAVRRSSTGWCWPRAV